MTINGIRCVIDDETWPDRARTLVVKLADALEKAEAERDMLAAGHGFKNLFRSPPTT
mgnify:CR=1 FL=1